MKPLRKILLIVTLTVITALLFSCAPGQEPETTPAEELVPVQRGDLTVDITAVGNLALSLKEDLAFEIPGTVEEVFVEEGDTVEEGQVLVSLDTSEWDEQLETLEDQVMTAERTLTTKERALATAEYQLISKELALRQAELNLRTAEFNLIEIAEVKEVQDKIDDAEADLNVALMMQDQAMAIGVQTDEDYWSREVLSIQLRLTQAQQEMREVLSDSSVTITTTVALEVAEKQLQVELTQGRLENAIKDVEDANVAIEDAQVDVEDAQKDLEDAREELAEAQSNSPEIIAPFSGFITKVKVDGGDEVLKGTVAIELADPTRFEADIMVNEMDIFQVQLGGTAWVQVDAMQGLSLPAKVTHISPTATIQQGVVNYEVKVEVQSFEEVMEEQQQAMQERQKAKQEVIPDISSGELPPRLQAAIEAGRITQEQAEEMLKRIQSGEMPSPPGSGMFGGTPGGMLGDVPEDSTSGISEKTKEEHQRQIPMMRSQDIQLREGLTVTVSIIAEERIDVLLVPNSAITTQGGRSYVTIGTAEDREKREIRTGLTDYQFTEVTEGLNEGEQVVVSQGTVSSTASASKQQIRMPFMPGRPR